MRVLQTKNSGDIVDKICSKAKVLNHDDSEGQTINESYHLKKTAVAIYGSCYMDTISCPYGKRANNR